MQPTTRRQFLAASAVTAASAAALTGTTSAQANTFAPVGSFPEPAADAKFAAPYGQPLFEISVAQWSLNKLFRGGQLDNRDFGKHVRETYDLDAVEWVSALFKDKGSDLGFIREMKQRCDDNGVKTLLMMIDGEGALGDPDKNRRQQAIENHYRWVAATKLLGGHSIRVNAQSAGSWDEQRDRAADGLYQLTEFARGFGINVIVENHGGLSSNGQWLSEVMEQVGLPECGTLPDFGNFNLGGGKQYDKFKGMHELMPYAKAVSAKCYTFDAKGDHVEFDFMRMMRIVLGHGYHGYVGIEFEGEEDGVTGVRKAAALLKKCRDELTA